MTIRGQAKFIAPMSAFMLAASLSGTAPAEAGRAGGVTGEAPERIVLARQSYTDVIATLERNGYRVVNMSSTLLGRVKIQARNRVHLREIVVSRSTGEIKHDVILKVYRRVKEGSEAHKRLQRRAREAEAAGNTGGGSSGSGSGGSGSSGGVSVGVGGGNGGGASVSVGGDTGGVSVDAGGGGGGGVSVDVGGGGVSANVGGIGVSIGN